MVKRNFLKGIGAAAVLIITALSSPAIANDQTIRVASVTGPSHHHNVSLRWFAERVASRNVGLNIEVLDGAQLGGERDCIEHDARIYPDGAGFDGPVADSLLNLIYLAYHLIRDTEHFKKVVSGPVGAEYVSMAEEQGFKILAWFDNGYRNVFNKVRPVVTPDDMAGLKIRVMESPLMVNTLNAMGGSRTLCLIVSCIQPRQGLDGGENAAGNVLNDKFYEVSGYFSIHSFPSAGCSGNKHGYLERIVGRTTSCSGRRKRSIARLRNSAHW